MTAGLDETTCRTMLAAYVEAEKAVLTGQSYTIGGRALTRANLAEIRQGRREWSEQLASIQAGRGDGMRVRGVTPSW